jgi:predicted phosphodiesterase
MSFQIVSDIHLERTSFNSLDQILLPCADNLILAGDIGNPLHPNLNVFLDQVSKTFKKIFYIPGNHEFYNTQGYSMTQMINMIRTMASPYPNIIILDNSTCCCNNIRIIGSTMWSHCPDYIQNYMNDYRYIYTKPNCLMTTQEVNLMFRESVIFIQHELLKAKKNKEIPLVITHHLPSFQCIDPKFYGSNLNHAFATNLDSILCGENVKYWIHGHTHSPVDIMIDGCRIIANPHGYTNENEIINKKMVLNTTQS